MLMILEKAVISAANPQEDATRALFEEFRKKAASVFTEIVFKEEEAETAYQKLREKFPFGSFLSNGVPLVAHNHCLREERVRGLWDAFTALTGISYSEKALRAILAYKAEMDAKSYVWGNAYIRKYGGCPQDFYLEIYLSLVAQEDKALKKLQRRKSIA
jgi:hypothetical protein